MAKSDALGTKGVDASKELLKLLRTINEKLDLGTVLNGREGVAVSGARQNWYPDGFYRWYEETLPSQSCPSESRSLSYLGRSKLTSLKYGILKTAKYSISITKRTVCVSVSGTKTMGAPRTLDVSNGGINTNHLSKIGNKRCNC